MSGRPKKTASFANTVRVRPFNYLHSASHVSNNSQNRTESIVNGKNARGYAPHIPNNNTRKSPMYITNTNGSLFKSTNAMTASPTEYNGVYKRSKDSLRMGINIPTIHRTRAPITPNSASRAQNRKQAMINLATFRNTGINRSPSKNYEWMRNIGEPMNEVIKEGEEAYINSGLPNIEHAYTTAQINQEKANIIAKESARNAAEQRGFYRMNGSRNVTRRRPGSARKSRKARRKTHA